MPKPYISTSEEGVQLFRSDFLNRFTRVHWAVPMVIYLPVVAVCLYVSFQEDDLALSEEALLFLAGVLTWTFVEYLIHRFLFHYEPRIGWVRRVHYYIHGFHHDYPNETNKLAVPPATSIPLAAAFYYLFRLAFGPFLVMPFFSGFVFGYMCYDTIHYATHHVTMRNTIGLYLKRHHLRHHYVDDEYGFGVTSPLWDFVFGTRPRNRPVSAGTADSTKEQCEVTSNFSSSSAGEHEGAPAC